ncbi:DUF5956 family protein [Paeniglutamicibacter sp. NPDC012692]|uniref:DUF5956 family protein n=1 Tax=Paeniglutamicibacter sp. NPDC012692 TaxID=3364388 RepID=UPI003690B4F4
MWESYPIGTRPSGWIELTENGWGAIASWFAGPENVMREPMGKRTDLVRVTCEKPEGTSTSWTETITEAEIEEIEDDIDGYLADSGLPSRPHGYRWFLRLPSGIKDESDFWSRLNEAAFKMPHTNWDPKREASNLGESITGLFSQMP